MIRSIVSTAAVIALATSALFASPIYNQQTGHYYEAISGTITWDAAKTAAETMTLYGVSGHLATVADSSENSFLLNTVLADKTGFNWWLGGTQPAASTEPAGGWKWVTGESIDWFNWYATEPSNDNGLENSLQLLYRDDFSPTAYKGYWNDQKNTGTSAGYIVEYSVPEPLTMTLLALGGCMLVRRK